jgi:hypothetical protein
MKTLPQLVSIAFALAISILSTALTSAVETGLTEQNGRARLQAARDEVSNLRSNIFLTLVALDQVRGEREPAGEHFQAFTNQLGRMEVLARAMGKRIDEMEKRGDAYFVDWEATTAGIQNQEGGSVLSKVRSTQETYDATAFSGKPRLLSCRLQQVDEHQTASGRIPRRKSIVAARTCSCRPTGLHRRAALLMQTEEELISSPPVSAKDG